MQGKEILTFDEKYLKIEDIAKRINKEMLEKSHVFVGIDGMCCAGKTTFAKELAKLFDCNVFHADDYFLQFFQKTEKRLNETGGNIDYERLKFEIINNKFEEKPYIIRKYDCQKEKLSKPKEFPQKQLTIIEGAYALHPFFGDVYDLKIVILIEKEKQNCRILERNGLEKSKHFQKTWIRKENKYLKKLLNNKLKVEKR